MKHLMTLMALVVAVTAGAQVMDTILTGNTVNMNLNYAKLDSIIADLQAKVATLEAAQTSAFDGTYGSLTGAPAIPSNVSDLTNDAGFTTFDGAYSSLSDLPSMAWVNLFGRDLITPNSLTPTSLTPTSLAPTSLYADLTNANLTNANLTSADLTTPTSLTPTSLTPTSITPTSLRRPHSPTSLTPTSLAPTSLELLGQELIS